MTRVIIRTRVGSSETSVQSQIAASGATPKKTAGLRPELKKGSTVPDGQVVPVPIREDQQNDDRFIGLVRFHVVLIRCSDALKLCGGRNQFPCLLLLQAYAFRPNANCFLGIELPVEVVKKRKMSS
jgi:hypothetical protein